MSSLIQVIFYSLVGGVFSLIGGIILIASEKRAQKLANLATPFAAGALLSAAFIDILPEAAHSGEIKTALIFTVVGILIFFILERFLRWFHHHRNQNDNSADPTALLIITGDAIHNFIDGIAIAAGFLVSPSTGIVVTLAVAVHEIPQEIGDFGLLLHKGMKRSNVVIANVFSALATTVAAIIFFNVGQSVELPLDIVLGIVAGFFIYIAVSDIIPDIHKKEGKSFAGIQTLMLIIGVIVVGFSTSYLHQFIDQDSHNHENESILTQIEENHDAHGEHNH